MKVIKTAIILIATTALLMIPTELIFSDQNIPDGGLFPSNFTILIAIV